MDGIALTNLGGVGALPGLSLQFVMESLATVFLASLRVGAFLIASPFFGGTSVPLQPRIIMAVLLGVAVVSNVTVPSWQSFDAMTTAPPASTTTSGTSPSHVTAPKIAATGNRSNKGITTGTGTLSLIHI